MMKSIVFILFFFVFTVSCKSSYKNEDKQSPNKDAVLTNTSVNDTLGKELSSTRLDTAYADFNGDGKKEAIWYEAAKIIENPEASCVDSSCPSVIKFSNTKIPPIHFTGVPYGGFELLGDLDDDKGEEIGFISLGYQSCWGNYTVWSLKNNKWKNLTDSLSYYNCNEEYTPVKKDPNKKGYLLIETFENGGDKVIKSVKIK